MEEDTDAETRNRQFRNSYFQYLMFLLLLSIIADTAPEESANPRLRNQNQSIKRLSTSELQAIERRENKLALSNDQSDTLTLLENYVALTGSSEPMDHTDELDVENEEYYNPGNFAAKRYNLTGIFKGSWTLLDMKTPIVDIPKNTFSRRARNSSASEERDVSIPNSKDLPIQHEIHKKYDVETSFGMFHLGVFSSVEINPGLAPKEANFPMLERKGTLKLQLQSLPTFVKGLHQIAGSLNLMDGENSKFHVDMLSTGHGFHFEAPGELSFITNSGFKGKRVAVEFPKPVKSRNEVSQVVESDNTEEENEPRGGSEKGPQTLKSNHESDAVFKGVENESQVDKTKANTERINSIKSELNSKNNTKKESVAETIQTWKQFIADDKCAVWDSEGIMRKEGKKLRDEQARIFRTDDNDEHCFFRFDLKVSQEVLDVAELPDLYGAQPVNLTGFATSVNCNVTLKVELQGLQINIEKVMNKAWSFSTIVTLTCFFQILLLIVQNQYADTQTAAAKASIGTVCMFTILDAYMCLAYLTSGVVIESLFNEFVTVAFFKLLLFALFEIRLLFTVYKAKFPDVFNEGETARRRELERLYVRFYVALLLLLLVSYQVRKIYPLFDCDL